MARRFQFDRPAEKIEKLTLSEFQGLLSDLLVAFQIVKDPEETALFVQDLLTKSEVKILAKRLRIAKLLLEGMTYREVEDTLHVSHGTVAKVAEWLKEKGDGFRSVIKKISKIRKEESALLASVGISLKDRIQRYSSLEPLIEKKVKSADEKEGRRLKKILDNLEAKSILNTRIEKMLKEIYVRK